MGNMTPSIKNQLSQIKKKKKYLGHNYLEVSKTRQYNEQQQTRQKQEYLLFGKLREERTKAGKGSVWSLPVSQKYTATDPVWTRWNQQGSWFYQP